MWMWSQHRQFGITSMGYLQPHQAWIEPDDDALVLDIEAGGHNRCPDRCHIHCPPAGCMGRPFVGVVWHLKALSQCSSECSVTAQVLWTDIGSSCPGSHTLGSPGDWEMFPGSTLLCFAWPHMFGCNNVWVERKYASCTKWCKNNACCTSMQECCPPHLCEVRFRDTLILVCIFKIPDLFMPDFFHLGKKDDIEAL